MENQHKILFSILIVVGAVSIFSSAAYLSPVVSSFFSEPDMAPMMESLLLQNMTAARVGDNLNISLTIVNTSPKGETQVIKEFEINHVEQKYVMDLEIYLNGTKTDAACSIHYNLESGAMLQVNLVVPSSNLNPANVLALQLNTPQAIYYKEIPFPPET